MGGLHTSTKTLTKQNAATLGVCLVVLGMLWGSLRLWVCDMPIQDSDEVGKSQKPLYIKIFLWEGRTQAFMEDKAKCSDLRGICGRFGAIMGSPTAMWVRYAHPGLR